MDILLELDRGVLPELPDYISPQAAPANRPFPADDQGTKLPISMFRVHNNAQGNFFHVAYRRTLFHNPFHHGCQCIDPQTSLCLHWPIQPCGGISTDLVAFSGASASSHDEIFREILAAGWAC